LDETIEKGGLPLVDVLEVLGQVADGLHYLHSHGVIHADIKPSNILITPGRETKAHLIDFGMVQHTESDDTILYIGTYQYLHPDLKGNLRHVAGTSEQRGALRERVGPYIDIYALGIVAFRLLSADAPLPRPLSERSLISILRDRNEDLRDASSSFTIQMANLLLQMLTVRPSEEGIAAGTVSSICGSLERIAREAPSRRDKHRTIFTATDDAERTTSDVLAVSEALSRLQKITESLESATVGILRTAERIEAPVDKNADAEVLNEMTFAFSNASKRVRASWLLAILMTSVSFLLIASMVVSALVLAFFNGKGAWGMIFGGASVTTIIGVLLWRPFDRVFRATILAQQIEMIHLQATSSYKTTSDFERRIDICRESLEALRTLFSEHEFPSKLTAAQKHSTKTKRKLRHDKSMDRDKQ